MTKRKSVYASDHKSKATERTAIGVSSSFSISTDGTNTVEVIPPPAAIAPGPAGFSTFFETLVLLAKAGLGLALGIEASSCHHDPYVNHGASFSLALLRRRREGISTDRS